MQSGDIPGLNDCLNMCPDYPSKWFADIRQEAFLLVHSLTKEMSLLLTSGRLHAAWM